MPNAVLGFEAPIPADSTYPMSVGEVLAQGNFGLGAFPNSSDCLIVLDGRAYRISESGQAGEANLASKVEWVGVLRFAPDLVTTTGSLLSIRDLAAHCDSLRTRDNCCYAYWLEGRIDQLLIRSHATTPSSIVWAYRDRPAAYEFENIRGSVVGFWSPEWASKPGRGPFLFYFLSETRGVGGVLHDVCSAPLKLRVLRFESFSCEALRTRTLSSQNV